MNIKEAKQQIKNAMTVYFKKDKYGNYVLPPEKQRPVFLMGAPGIGKTAIMEQVAAEMGVGLLSYSMTHHTRQSALGLPVIVHKNYNGVECDVSEYTMSEIIASVYELMEKTGVKEGILFLDEINCVSETLAPLMLQFLQYKVFGRHKVPDGWIVVTAGNPPLYNKSVHEFDIATWDRLKRIDVEPDFDCWQEYAYKTGVHPAIIAYLKLKKNNFYKIENTPKGKVFVTARGWEDMSRVMSVYEDCGITVDKQLISQYLQDPKIANDFAIYYELFNKYKSDYRIEEILSGTASKAVKERAKAAKSDEALSLVGLLVNGLTGCICEVLEFDSVTAELAEALRGFKTMSAEKATPTELLINLSIEKKKEVESGTASGSLSTEKQRTERLVCEALEEMASLVGSESDFDKAFGIVKKNYSKRLEKLKKLSEETETRLANVFAFTEEIFGNENEMLMLVTELTANSHCAAFIGKFGCDAYFRHNKELMLFERQQELTTELEKLKF